MGFCRAGCDLRKFVMFDWNTTDRTLESNRFATGNWHWFTAESREKL
jgi:hypothetical protein